MMFLINLTEFNNNDIDAVMNFFAEDAVFDHAIGPSPYGKRFIGISEIRNVFSGLLITVTCSR